MKNYLILLFLAATNLIFSQQEIQVRNNITDIPNNSLITSATNNTNFGQFDINSGAKNRTYTIRNIGNSNLILGTPSITFQNPSSNTFSLTSIPANNTVIAPNTSVNFIVSFDPNNMSVFDAKIQINSNDSNENPFIFAVQGEGVLLFPDTDDDGVSNNIDIDDDNDGIRDAVEQSTCLAISTATTVSTIFLNENFGAGTNRVRINGTTAGVSTNYYYEDGTSAQATDEIDTNSSLNDGQYTVHYSITDNSSPTNISATGPDLATWADNSWSNIQDHTPNDTNGRMAVFNAANTPGEFYKTTIRGILPGVPLNYSFWAVNIDANDAAFNNVPRILPNVTVNFLSTDGLTLLHTFNTGNITRCLAGTGNSCITSLWKNFTTNTILNTTEFIIQLVNNSTGGLGNDLAIDDILITQTLCDSDGDGISDIIDLDNDNDGMPNVLEYSLFNYTNNNLNLDPDKDATFGGNTFTDTNRNGMNDNAENLQPAIDTDGDGVKDYLDLDSDNDGVFDTVEYDSLGDADSTGDGLGDGNDIFTVADDEFDGDGILGIMDNNDNDNNLDDHGTNSYPSPLDSDNDGIPDYLDVNKGPINDITSTIYSFLDTNNNGIIDGTGDLDKDGLLDIFDSNDNKTGSPRLFNNKYSIIFDGRNDYIQETITGTDLIQGKNKTTLMAWVKLANNYSGLTYIAGQKNFKIAVNNNQQMVAYVNGIAFTNTTFTLPTNRWVHLTMVYDGVGATKKVNTYINGDETQNITTINLINTDTNKNFTIGRNADNTAALGYFNGEIDDVKVYDAVLTPNQIQSTVFQELNPSNLVRGMVIPFDIPGLAVNSLLRYFHMNIINDDVVDNLTTPAVDLINGAKLFNIQKINIQTAPLPFETNNAGNWNTAATWKNNSVLDLDIVVTPKPWSIINIKNNVTVLADITCLGLIIDNGATLKTGNLTNSYKLENSWYLKLNGTLDLENESQLVQTSASILDATSSGKIEKDQQGTLNSFTYNYFSSPVNPINATTNNTDYSIGNVLKDGTNPANPLTPNFQAGVFAADNAQTSPVTLSTFWMYKYINTISNDYSWVRVRDTGTLKVGEGFTMKGTSNTGAVQNNQNYVFVGKPNNGDVTLPIGANNVYLVGNPYPSALNANTFINENPDLTGSLYFWDHFGGGSHLLAQYQGGYAIWNAIGGTVAVDQTAVTGGISVGNKQPGSFVPVGQGFFVKAKTTNGTVRFKNTQRTAGLNLLREVTGVSTFTRQVNTNNLDVDSRQKIRIDIQTNDYKRQLLVGVDSLATSNIDDKFDAENLDQVTNDASWLIENKKHIIQGVPSFENAVVLPIGVKVSAQANITFNINALENISAEKKIYLKDQQNNVYHDLTTNQYTTQVTAGENNTRFAIVFQNDNALSNQNFDELQNQIQVYGGQKTINLFNNSSKNIETLDLYDLNGRLVLSKTINSIENATICIDLSAAVYLVKIKTEEGTITKKIIIS
jgi:putative surface-exposed virulence protein